MSKTVLTIKMKKTEAITKKYINEPDHVVDDALRGLTDYNPSVAVLTSFPRVVVRRDLNTEDENDSVRSLSKIDWPNIFLQETEKQRKQYFVWGINNEKRKKVSLIAGGGSGHEPFAAGYVGKGMLTAAIAGNIFASPPSRHVQAALESTQSDAGSILFVINYTGDRLNFGLAAERFKAKGNEVKILTIADDIAIDPSKVRIGSRGLAGAILVLKIAGALAEQGSSLAQIESSVKEVIRNLRTIGCSLGPCSIPGKGPMIQLSASEYEVGLGIHGEAGKERIELESAHKIVERLMKDLIPDAEKEREIVILLNNLGGTCQLELDLLKGEILHWCVENNVKVKRIYCGSYMTSLDAHGISITVLDIHDLFILDLLDAPADCPGWRMGTLVSPNLDESLTSKKEVYDKEFEEPETEEGKEIVILRKIIDALCKEMSAKEDELNRLDGSAGDGDCGSTFKGAVDAVEKRIKKNKLCLSDIKKCTEQVATIFEENVGGTSGAIYALLLSVMAQVFDKDEANVAKALKNATEAVEKYGGAKAGDRTMVDTLRSAIEAIETNASIDWEKVITAAEEGAKRTTIMKAGAGRASYTSEKVQTEPDAGAMAMAYWMRTIWNVLKEDF